MKPFFKILRKIIILGLGLILLANSYLLMARFVFHENLPRIFGYSQAIVVSGSMEPLFSAGDLLLFREQETYEINDVVIFSQQDYYVTHRIVDTKEGGFVTQGDANNTQDEEVLRPEQIQGKMVAVFTGVGAVLTFFKSPLGIFILIILGTLLIEIPYMLNENQKKRRMRK